MKKLMFILMMFFVFFVTACASEQQKSAGSKPIGQAVLFNESWELPCQMYDDDEYFAAVGIAKGSMEQKIELQKTALANAQDICRQNVKHEYWDLEQVDGNGIIDTVVNNAQAKCVKYSGAMEEGKIEVYVGIKISKRELAEKMVNELVFTIEKREQIPQEYIKNLSEELSEEEKAQIDFKAAEYEEKMQKYMESKETEKKESIAFVEEAFNKAVKEKFEKFKEEKQVEKENLDKVRKENPRDTKNEQKVLSACMSESRQALGESWELPCQMYDDDDYFTATGIAKGNMDEKGKLQESALYDAKQLVQWKVRSAYRWIGIAWMLRDFGFVRADNKKEVKIIDKIRHAGISVIETVTNNAQAKCVKYSGIMADGMIEAYAGIQISRREVAEKMLGEIEKILGENKKNEVSFDEKERIEFDEHEFIKRMEEKLKEYKKESEE
jgi:hypothetical protein